MSVRRVLRMGDPQLLRISEPVQEFNSPRLRELLADMRDTMAALSGAGLAAPQIGVPLRVVIFGTGAPNPRYPEAEVVPATVLVNPEIAPLGPDVEQGWEGCLSVPGMRGLVPRYRELHYRGVDEQGRAMNRRVSGFHARVVQHEVDHLDGILYPMRMTDMSRFGFNEELFPGQTLEDD
ncbi:MAG TPA: peptide deformylase [Steroidobacteraceae bacterium]|jgi:peptide deformylase|nr:peptide deformylase [Steroidobacteraceae bacterium]